MANPSGTDLAQLEYEFATNPGSEAFIPLAEAYLGMGRFVEAMVVCKKGIKAHPELPTGRLIMARIYSDQAKHQKAIEELRNLLKLNTEIGEAYRLLGNIQLKLGHEEEGINHLKKALDVDPDDREARESLLKIGIDYVPTAQQPAPQPQPEAQPQQTAQPQPTAQQPAAQQPAPANVATDPGTPQTVPTQPGMPASEQPTERAMPTLAQQAGLEQPVPTPAPISQPPATYPTPVPAPRRKRIADIYQEMEEAHKKPERKGIKLTLYMGGALVLVLIIYVIYTWQAGLKQEKINKHLESGRSLFNQDSYRGYKEALEHYLAIHELDDSHPEALSRGAFICAVLAGEFNHKTIKVGDKVVKTIDKGSQLLAKGLAAEQDSNMLVAARALITVYGAGNSNEAIKQLEAALKTNSDSAVINSTLGLIQLHKGHLMEARGHLEKGAAQSDIRALVGMGDYAMRRTMYQQAARAYNRALQIDRGHIGALLGKTLAALAWGDKHMHTQEAKDNLQRFKAELEKNASDPEKRTAEFIDVILKCRDRKTRRSGFNQLKSFLQTKGSKPVYQFIAARGYRRNNKFKTAKEAIGKALRLDSSRPDFLLEEAYVYLALKDWEGARSRAMRLRENDPDCGKCMLIVGDAYFGEKNYDKAKNTYREATRLEDVAAEAHLKLAEVYLQQPAADRDRAQAQLELAMPALMTGGERRKAAEAALMLAKMYADKQRTGEFINILKRAINNDPTFAPPYCLIAANIKTDTKDGREQAKEFCGNCVKFDESGHYSASCKKILRELR